jgi:energy-coupling factor transporter ATP-binding protein EcfA2
MGSLRADYQSAMITLLEGPNFSGRSGWLEKYVADHPWPTAALLSNSGESALTGLSMGLREELSLDTRSLLSVDITSKFVSAFDLAPLLDRPFHVLSGGELVRCAVASALKQGVRDILVDTAFEQFDSEWRDSFLRLFSQGSLAEVTNLILADNRLLADDREFGRVMQFQREKGEGASTPVLDAKECAKLVKKSSCRATLTNVTFRYARKFPYIFKDVSLEFAPGNLYVLSGKNGSGKTTLLRLLSGTVLPSGGEIRFDKVRFDPRKRGRFVALAFQNPDYQFSRRSVGGELRDALTLANSEPRELVRLLEAGGIGARDAETNPYDLPFVLKKRLSNFIAALSGQPIIAFDEPTLAQDDEYRSSFVDLLHTLTNFGRSILLISHDTQLLDRLPNRITLHVGDFSIRPQIEAATLTT